MKEIFSNFDLMKTIEFITMGIGIGLGAYLGRYIKPFFIWIKGGVENGDKRLENKELQIAIFTFYFGFMIAGTTFFEKDYSMEMVLGALAGAGIMYGMNALAKKQPDIKDEEKK